MKKPIIALKTGKSDQAAKAIAAARKNLAVLPGSRHIRLQQQDFRDLPGLSDATIVCNPPYGVRLGTGEDATRIYKEFGDFLKKRCPGSTAYVYCGVKELVPALGLKPSWKKPLFNGPLEGRLVKLEMY